MYINIIYNIHIIYIHVYNVFDIFQFFLFPLSMDQFLHIHSWTARRCQAKLQCLVTLRNTAKSWRRNLQGYSWHTEEELKTTLGWNELLACQSMLNMFKYMVSYKLDSERSCLTCSLFHTLNPTHKPTRSLGQKWRVLSSTAQSERWQRLPCCKY